MSDIIVELKSAGIFRDEKEILKDVSFEIKKGEFVFLTGAVGSGKSSLIKTLYADLPLLKGTANVCGYKLENISRKKIPFLRRRTGIVFQDFQLLNDRNIFANLEVVLKATGWTAAQLINKRIDEVLYEVGLLDKKNKMPHQLSGGEQQRIVIARAILNNPPFILADEPTGNLDPDSAQLIMNIFKAIQKNGNSILMATHNYDLIRQIPSKEFNLDKGLLFQK